MVGRDAQRVLTRGGSVPQDDVVDADLLDALLARIVPADESGPGAIELGLGEFVRARLAGMRHASAAVYATGLRTLDERSRARFGHGFATASGREQDELIGEAEAAEADLEPWERPHAFVETVLRDVREGMFGDPVHGGNRDAAGWDLLGYPDPRRVWTAEDQRLDVVHIPLLPRTAGRPARLPIPTGDAR
jgi:hypothetical protein